MKRAVILMIACMFVWTHRTPASESFGIDTHAGHMMPPGGSMLPSPDTALYVVNATGPTPDVLRNPASTYGSPTVPN